MDDKFFHHPGQILREDRLGVFTQSPFLPVHFHWTTTKSLQAKAKAGLHDIWMAPTKAQADKAFDGFLQTYEAKYQKVADCLQKDREALLAFYQFPAEHWQHIRTTNPIESTFATVRLRTGKTRGCLSRATA